MTNKKKAAGFPAAAQAITHPESTKIARVLAELRIRSLTRFSKPARVKRYSYAGGARHV